MLSNTGKTAVKAVIYLASKAESGDKSSIKEIAKYINASQHTVGKLLQTLVKQQIINSVKGPSGGFYITNEQRRQPIINIIYSIDGKEAFNQCGLGLSRCSSAHPCPIHNEYKQGRVLIQHLFETKNIADLYEPVEHGLAYLIG